MITNKDLTPFPATEPVLVGTPQPEEVGFRIPAPEDPVERAEFEAAVARRDELGLSPFVGEDYLPRHAAPAKSSVRVTTAQDTAVGEVLAIHDRLLDAGSLIPTALSAAIEQLRQAVRLEAPLPSAVPLMNVRVLDRGGLTTAVRTVTIPAICPSCGGPRSQDLVETISWIHGIKMVYDRWANQCGHVDEYSCVLTEARRFNELVRGGA